jgi:phosphinothricin acetyltransferase
MLIEPLTGSDWDAVRAIYLEGIATGNATFEQSSPEWEQWNAGHLKKCRLVARSKGAILGWAALSPVSGRCVRRRRGSQRLRSGRARGQGIGAALLSALVRESEQAGLWTLQAGNFPEHQASIKLHLNAGSRVVGTRERFGPMNGHWRVLMERRSGVVGV